MRWASTTSGSEAGKVNNLTWWNEERNNELTGVRRMWLKDLSAVSRIWANNLTAMRWFKPTIWLWRNEVNNQQIDCDVTKRTINNLTATWPKDCQQIDSEVTKGQSTNWLWSDDRTINNLTVKWRKDSQQFDCEVMKRQSTIWLWSDEKTINQWLCLMTNGRNAVSGDHMMKWNCHQSVCHKFITH